MNNDIFPNKFKAALAAHQIQIGCWSPGQPYHDRSVRHGRFRLAGAGRRTCAERYLHLYPQLMALKGSASAPVVRVPTNEPVIIKRLLDIGFYNF